MLSLDFDKLGADWLADEIDALCDEIIRTTPVQFSEQFRYLPESVTSRPGPMSFDVNPFMREIVDCADPRSTVREVNLMKGVQTTYTTLLESILFHFMAEVKTGPAMLVTAEKELASARVENNILPMLQQSGFAHIIRSSDEGNSRKTGKTANHLQWEGGGYMVPIGANNPSKMRMFSILLMLKDEIDAWPDIVGRDGDPDKLTDDRCSAFWSIRKIFRGSTPLIKDTSKIYKQYLRGDRRKYFVKCLECGFEQTLRWTTKDEETGIVGGIHWEMDGESLDAESVHYACAKCGHKHFEHDKPDLFANGRWKPTAQPREPGIRSYHLPALYSPYGFASWAKCVSDYLDAFDPINKRVRDIGKFQAFYNNILGEPFEIMGQKVTFQAVSGHRRAVYRMGEIPNAWAKEFAGSEILFLTCQVDVHKSNLAVAVMGWTVDARCFVIDYWRFENDDCTEISSPVWGRLQSLIEEKEYTADDGKKYRIQLTLVDSGYANDTVVKFCSQYEGAVYPILGRERPAKNQTIREFAPFKTQDGTTGYRITVDHYKDRLGPVLRRDWTEQSGSIQPEYHLNVPIDASDKQIKELTAEYRRKEVDAKGRASYTWYRPNSVDNEFWDLLVYGHTAVEMIAWDLCVNAFELETVDWRAFWQYIQNEKLYYTE